MPSWRSATAMLVPVVLICWVTACSSAPDRGSAVPNAAVTAVAWSATPAQSSSPSQVTPIATWQRYISSKWGYSLNYPQQWFSLPNNGAPDTDKYFSNENVGAPPEMTKTGIYLTVRVTSGACAPAAGEIDGQATLIVAGSPITRTYGLLSPPAGERAWVIDAAIAHSSRCVAFHYLAQTQAARDGSLPIADAMISSLNFS